MPLINNQKTFYTTAMTIEEQVNKLSRGIEEFVRCMDSLPRNLFLKKINNWSSRDVLAHLIGWNRYTIKGCERIRRGELPFYFIDPGNNFSKVNAVLVQKYSSRNKRKLVDELKVSSQELKQFILSFDPAEWEADRGVRHEGGSVTIKNTVDVLIRDYIHHKEQIEKWAKSANSV